MHGPWRTPCWQPPPRRWMSAPRLIGSKAHYVTRAAILLADVETAAVLAAADDASALGAIEQRIGDLADLRTQLAAEFDGIGAPTPAPATAAPTRRTSPIHLPERRAVCVDVPMGHDDTRWLLLRRFDSSPFERRERDSNPRWTVKPTHDFQSCPFSRSGTSPGRPRVPARHPVGRDGPGGRDGSALRSARRRRAARARARRRP
jgi:hypothetical protein